jgi:hypothetical protein
MPPSAFITELLSVGGSVASLVALALYFRPANRALSAGEAIGWTVAAILLVMFFLIYAHAG